MTSEQPSRIMKDFEDALREILGDHSEELELLKDIPNIQHALVQHEVKRLDRKLGKDHPRVRNMRTGLIRNQDLIRSFSPDRERQPEEEPEAVSNDAMIMGRLVDEKNIPMTGMTVDIEDESGRKISYLGKVKTDSAGNFALRIDQQSVEKLGARVGGAGYLTVRDHKGKVVHQDVAPVRPPHGGQINMNIAVSTERFSGKEQVLKPRGPIKRPPMDAGFGKGSPERAPLDGKGDDVTARIDGKGDDVTAEKRIDSTEPLGMMEETPTMFTPSPEKSTKGERPPEPFGRERETAKGAIGMGGARMDHYDEEEGEDIVAARGMAGRGGQKMNDDEGEEDVQGHGMAGKGGQVMDYEDEGEDIVAGRGMAGKGSMRDVPPDVPPGPRPEDLAKKPEKHGFFRKGRESDSRSPDPRDVPQGVEGKKAGRKEKRKRGK